MENIVRTIYGAALQSTLFAGLPYSHVANTTLNEKFGVLAGVTPPDGVTPTCRYFCIGNGGHKPATGTGGIGLIEAQQHLATDAALYNHLPFILRATNNDIAPSVQAKYALRTQISIGGVSYYAYYLKRLDLSNTLVTESILTIFNGETTTASFIPTEENLEPTPPTINPTGVNLITSQYANVAAALPISFTEEECTELLNAATILYGDSAYAIISEIGLCSGVDKAVTLQNGNTFMEAVSVQICSLISTMHVVKYSSTGITGSAKIGSSEPLLVLNPT